MKLLESSYIIITIWIIVLLYLNHLKNYIQQQISHLFRFCKPELSLIYSPNIKSYDPKFMLFISKL